MYLAFVSTQHERKGGEPTKILLPLPSQDAKPFLFSHALEHISLRSVFVFQAIHTRWKKKKSTTTETGNTELSLQQN